MSFVSTIKKYDGSLLHNRFAYRYLGNQVIPIGNIISFRGPMEVLADQMIDQEDVNKQDFIYSDDAVNFLWEIPLLGDNSFGAVAHQRLFCANVGNILGSSKYLNKPVDVRGDDIYVKDEFTQRGIISTEGKCSVSIVHIKNGAALGHLGINIVAGDKAPVFAYSTKLSNEQVTSFCKDVAQMFYEMNDSIFVAGCKIISK